MNRLCIQRRDGLVSTNSPLSLSLRGSMVSLGGSHCGHPCQLQSRRMSAISESGWEKNVTDMTGFVIPRGVHSLHSVGATAPTMS